MKVNFRVVGVFCDLKDVNVGNFLVQPTVRDVMTAIRGNPSLNFTFKADDEVNPSVPSSTASLFSVECYKPLSFTTNSGHSYPAGSYALADSIDQSKGVAYVFQYYLVRPVPGANYVQNISGGNKFISFGNSEKVNEGDSIIWRQVSINLPKEKKSMESHPQFKRFQSLGVV